MKIFKYIFGSLFITILVILFLFYIKHLRVNKVCRSSADYKVNECILDHKIGSALKVKSISALLNRGCQYKLQVLEYGDLTHIDNIITDSLMDARDEKLKIIFKSVKKFKQQSERFSKTACLQ